MQTGERMGTLSPLLPCHPSLWPLYSPQPAGCISALLSLILPGAWKLLPHPPAVMFSSPCCASAAVPGLGMHPHWMCCQQLGCDTIPWVHRVPKGCASEPGRDNRGQNWSICRAGVGVAEPMAL